MYSRILVKLILTYIENLNIYKKRNQSGANIKVGDFVIYSGLNKEMSQVITYKICRVVEVIRGRNGDED